mgnify:CR=1 FL=1
MDVFEYLYLKNNLVPEYEGFSLEVDCEEHKFRLKYKDCFMYALITSDLKDIAPFLSGFRAGQNFSIASGVLAND